MGGAKQCHALGSDPPASQKLARRVQSGRKTQGDLWIGDARRNLTLSRKRGTSTSVAMLNLIVDDETRSSGGRRGSSACFDDFSNGRRLGDHVQVV